MRKLFYVKTNNIYMKNNCFVNTKKVSKETGIVLHVLQISMSDLGKTTGFPVCFCIQSVEIHCFD